MFVKFDEIPAMTLQDIKETKCYGRTNAWTDNVKTVYPPQTKFAGGIKTNSSHSNRTYRRVDKICYIKCQGLGNTSRNVVFVCVILELWAVTFLQTRNIME